MTDRKKLIFLALAATAFLAAGIVLLVETAGTVPAEKALPESAGSENISKENGSVANASAETGPAESSPDADIPIEPIAKTVNGIRIAIDPRIELLAAVQLISGYDQKFGLLTRKEFSYKESMRKHFTPYSTHEAVKLFTKMSNSGFTFDAPPTAMLFLSNPPDLAVARDFSPYILQRAGKTDLERFVPGLRKFALASGFGDFYLKNKDFYHAALEENSKIIGDNNYISELESYYGMKQSSYNIILSPLFHSGGFGPRLEKADGSFDIFSLQGPQAVENGIPLFGSRESTKELVWHEFGHSFVNPLGNRYRKELNKYENLFHPLAEQMKKQAYSDWLTCVNEHVDRAVSCRLAYLHDGEEAYESALASQKGSGFLYMDPLVEKLADYEKSRDRYQTFEDFYPEIINVFKALSEKGPDPSSLQLSFSGPVNAVFVSGKPISILIPTKEESEEVQQAIRATADKARELLDKNFRIRAEIITDEQALKADLGNRNLIVYGTLEGNLWLAKYASTFPFEITGDSITADKTYQGEDLRFITALPNPVNEECGIVIYTAQKARDIHNINTVFHGPTDYVIARGAEEIGSGNYQKTGEK